MAEQMQQTGENPMAVRTQQTGDNPRVKVAHFHTPASDGARGRTESIHFTQDVESRSSVNVFRGLAKKRI